MEKIIEPVVNVKVTRRKDIWCNWAKVVRNEVKRLVEKVYAISKILPTPYGSHKEVGCTTVSPF